MRVILEAHPDIDVVLGADTVVLERDDFRLTHILR